MAIVTGRAVSDVRGRLGFEPHYIVGSHGAEDGLDAGAADAQARALDPLRDLLRLRGVNLAAAGIWVEDKVLSIALHYRQSPDLCAEVIELARDLVGTRAELSLQPGDCVVEIKPAGADKGRALTAFLAEQPFAGRMPVMVGDDLTDEHAFAAAQANAGFGVIVGSRRPTRARFALDGPSEVVEWLRMPLVSGHNRDPS